MAARRIERLWVLVCAALLLALLACKKKPPPPDTSPPAPTVSPTLEKAKKVKPDAKARMEAIAGLFDKAKSEPKVKKTKEFDDKLEKTKFIVVGDKWLNDVHRDPGDGELDLEHTVLSLCGYATDKKDEEIKDDDLKYMQECLDWEYVAVVRSNSLTEPRINLSAKTFTPGDFRGDCLLFEIKSGEIKGRYKMHITNSDSITYEEGKSEKDWLDMAKIDLVSNVRGVAEEKLQHERDTMGD